MFNSYVSLPEGKMFTTSVSLFQINRAPHSQLHGLHVLRNGVPKVPKKKTTHHFTSDSTKKTRDFTMNFDLMGCGDSTRVGASNSPPFGFGRWEFHDDLPPDSAANGFFDKDKVGPTL
jgi:hypothetical protein